MRRSLLAPWFLTFLATPAAARSEPGSIERSATLALDAPVATDIEAGPIEPSTAPPPASRALTSAPGTQAPSTPPLSSDEMTLTPEMAVQRALSQSPSLELAALSVRSAAQQVRAELGRYPYLLLADAGATRTESPQLRADDSVAATAVTSLDASLGVRRTFSTGTVAEIQASEQYFDRDITQVTVNPFQPAPVGYGSSLHASLTQPLLRGAGNQIGEVELRAARASREVNERALQRVQSALVRDVLAAYCELWYAKKAVAIEEQALQLALDQQRQAEERAALGSLAPSELFTFQTRSLELNESVVMAKLSLRQRSLALSQLMGDMDGTPSTLVATQLPEFDAGAPNGSALQRAMEAGSPELAELKQQVALARIRADVAGDASRPRLDAQASMQTNGVSRDASRAWQRAAGLQWWSAGATLTLELPLDDSRLDAQRTQAHLAVISAESQLSAARDRLSGEAALAIANDAAARARRAGAERTLAVAENAAKAAQGRFELGQTIAIALRQAEDDLRRARLRVLRAQVDVVQQRLIIDHLRDVLRDHHAALGSEGR